MPAMTLHKAMGANRVRTFSLALLTLLVAASIGLLLGAKPAHAATTFTVNRTADTRDANLSDARCDANASASGNQCTLRAAIQEANDTAGADLIRFNIVSAASVKTISPASALPTIRESVTINGYSQPGASENTLAEGDDAVLKIQLNGTNAGTVLDTLSALNIRASNSTIKGLVINRFPRDGIDISGDSSTGNEVLGNFIGTNAAGSTALANDGSGVFVFEAPDNTIGGTAAGARNVISGNSLGGVFIENSSSTGNKVEGNTIRNNADDGVLINLQGLSAADNTIGGNQISANGEDGVSVRSGTGNSILSNEIFDNASLGIDLDPNGVTSNDTDDPDTGANNLQNFPQITSAARSISRDRTAIRGTLNSNPNQSFIIQCFVADGDTSNHGEGQIPAGHDTTVQTDAGGDAGFTCGSVAPRAGDEVSATATNTATGDTSEFSLDRSVSSVP